MSGKDYIPRSDGDFLEWVEVLIAHAAENTDRLGFGAALTEELER